MKVRNQRGQASLIFPRVSRLMALTIRLDGLIRDGVVTDQAELARLGHVTRARLTQIMNLLWLAPDIQEAILFLPATERGWDGPNQRGLTPLIPDPFDSSDSNARMPPTRVEIIPPAMDPNHPPVSPIAASSTGIA